MLPWPPTAPLPRRLAALALVLTGSLAWSQAIAIPQDLSVAAGQRLLLQARRTDGREPHWNWSVRNGDVGRILNDPFHRTFYRAPEVLADITIQLQVTDAGTGEAITVPVHILAKAQGSAAQGGTPSLRLSAGTLHWPGNGSFSEIRCVRYVENDPALGALNHEWLVGDDEGLVAVSRQGESHRLPGLGGSVTALAVRTSPAGPGSTLHVVFAQTLPPDLEHPTPQGMVFALEPDGKARPLAGQGPDGRPDGTFGVIVGLVLQTDGTVWLADQSHRAIRSIAVDGTVTTVAGAAPGTAAPALQGVVDGTGQHAIFGLLRGMAQNPATGEVYVTDGHALRRIDPAGAVSTLLGDWAQAGFDPMPPGQAVPLQLPCLNEPADLQVHGGRVFIADTGNQAIQVFDLNTRVMGTLLGAPSQALDRLGPLRLFSPERAPAICAAIRWPRVLGINHEGACRLGLPFGLAEADLHTLAEPPTPGSTRFPCPVLGCPSALSSSTSLAKHLLTIHSEARPWVCPLPGCTMAFKVPQALRSHLLNRHHLTKEEARRLSNNKRKPDASTPSPTESSSSPSGSDQEPPLKRQRSAPVVPQ